MMALLMGLKTVSPGKLQELMGNSSVALFDVNSFASWREAHVPGARHLDPDGFAASDLPPDRGAKLVFYCSHPLCRKAPRAAQRARKLGYADVLVLSAGIQGWLGAGLPVESEAT